MSEITEKNEDAAVPRLSLKQIKALCAKLDNMTSDASLGDGAWDHELVCDVADQLPWAVDWIERARVELERSSRLVRHNDPQDDGCMSCEAKKLLAELEGRPNE